MAALTPGRSCSPEKGRAGEGLKKGWEKRERPASILPDDRHHERAHLRPRADGELLLVGGHGEDECVSGTAMVFANQIS